MYLTRSRTFCKKMENCFTVDETVRIQDLLSIFEGLPLEWNDDDGKNRYYQFENITFSKITSKDHSTYYILAPVPSEHEGKTTLLHATIYDNNERVDVKKFRNGPWVDRLRATTLLNDKERFAPIDF